MRSSNTVVVLQCSPSGVFAKNIIGEVHESPKGLFYDDSNQNCKRQNCIKVTHYIRWCNSSW